MLQRIQDSLTRFREKRPTLYQLLSFWLLGGVAMAVDLLAFALFQYWLFAGLKDVGASWWLFDYGVQNGGLCALLSLACSFALSQTVNFFVQRKATFHARNHALKSGILYALMVVLTYFFILWLPTLYIDRLYALAGERLGALLSKLTTQLISLAIQFPLNKWVIMK